MRTALNLDDELIAQARRLTGVQEETRLLHLGLKALIQREGERLNGALEEGTLTARPRKTLPVSKARGGLVDGFATLEDAIATADLHAAAREVF